MISANILGFGLGLYYSLLFVRYDSGQYNVSTFTLGTAAALCVITAIPVVHDQAGAVSLLGQLGCCVAMVM